MRICYCLFVILGPEQSWGQFLFINFKFHSNSFLSIPESIAIPLVLRKVNSNSIPIPKKLIPYQFHPRMRFLIHILPRLTTKIYRQKADTINSHLAKLSNDLNCNFIDNDSNMRFASGSLDESIFAIKVHLNHNGTERLIQNLQLHGLIFLKANA